MQRNGRIPPELPEFTFVGSDITVRLRKVSPFLLGEVAKSVPKPMPPLNTVDYGNGPTQEPNEADPGYLQALEEYKQEVGNRNLRALIHLGVECEVDAAAVQALRTQMATFGVDLDPDDKWVYIVNIAITDTDEIVELRDAILRKSQPTEGAVQESLAAFPGDVSRS